MVLIGKSLSREISKVSKKEIFQAGDLIEHFGWLGMVVVPNHTKDTMLVFVIKNSDFSHQIGTVFPWTIHTPWRVICRC